MHGVRRDMGSLMAGLSLGLILALGAGAAGAESLMGEAVVLRKDVEAGTIEVNGERVFQVTPSTVLAGVDGERISFAELPVAEEVDPGVFEISGEATIHWQGRVKGSGIVLDRIDVLGEPLE